MNATKLATKGASGKILHLMRHGRTVMNQYTLENPYESPGFRDPLFYDTRLTKEGRAGAKRAARLTRDLDHQPELLIVSPLTRALHTAELAWEHYQGPVLVEALATERVWLSSEIGRHPKELQQEFAGSRFGYTFHHLEDIWWYNNHPESDPLHVSLEPEDVFLQRIGRLKQYLLQRPELVIGMVAHWEVINALTGGADLENCELRTYTLTHEGHVRERHRYATVRHAA